MRTWAPHARECCPTSALRALSPAELAALDRYCRRALDDPDAEHRDDDEAAVARYEALLAPPRRESIPRVLDASGRLK
jgi:hypothetical protein